MKYLVYSDGSASVKDRTGGYAWKIVYDDGKEFVGGGSEVDTTINRMELMAAIDALEQIDAHEYLVDHDVVLVISDSEYVVKGFNDKGRARNKNVDLWLRLEAAAACFELVCFEHIKGHVGHPDNEEVDKLAGEFRQAAVQSLKS